MTERLITTLFVGGPDDGAVRETNGAMFIYAARLPNRLIATYGTPSFEEPIDRVTYRLERIALFGHLVYAYVAQGEFRSPEGEAYATASHLLSPLAHTLINSGMKV